MVTLAQWLEYIESEIGFVLPTSQHHWLTNAIQTTANAHQLTSDQLWVEVQLDNTLKQRLFDTILILESRFFRHTPSIEFITEQALTWKKNKRNARQALQPSDMTPYQPKDIFRIWSIGCSEGQEVWSLAMNLSGANFSDYSILGTDISTKAIHSASQAIYSTRSLAEIPEQLKQYVHHLPSSKPKDERIYHPIQDDDSKQSTTTGVDLEKLSCQRQRQWQGQWQVDQALRSKVSFMLNNIFADTSALPPTQLITLKDVIICQNMLIYFRQFDQRDILSRLVAHCELGGHIVLAPGEALSWSHPKMERVAMEQVNAWRKVVP